MIVFTDTFTVAADVDPASYPATPDYSYLKGAVNDAQIPAATDRVEIVVTGAPSTDIVLRLIDGICPTGDQEIIADCHLQSGFYGGYLAVRCDAATQDCYVGELDTTVANEVQLYRMDGGTFTQIASADRGIANTEATHSYRLRATETNPVALEFQVNATAALLFEDSDAARKQSGRSGIGGVNATTRTAWVDNVSVDDLVVAGSGPERSLPYGRLVGLALTGPPAVGGLF